jgi:uncharacterized protein (TIGR00106 family)
MVAEFSIMPVGKSESLSADVTAAIKLVVESGLPAKVGPMSTSIEGEWEEVMGLVKRCRDKMLETCNRVYLVIKIDDRKGSAGRINGKIASVEEKLGKPLSK